MIVKLCNFQKKIEGKENNKKQKKVRWKKNKEERSSRGQRSVGPWISSSSVCKKNQESFAIEYRHLAERVFIIRLLELLLSHNENAPRLAVG